MITLTPIKTDDADVISFFNEKKYDLGKLELYRAAHAAKGQKETFEIILNQINQKCKLNLRFGELHDDNIKAYDKLNRLYLVIGNWNRGRYMVRGVIRRKTTKGRKPMTWLINGQASNAKQIAFFGEEYTIEFPEITKAIDDYNDMIVGRNP